MWQGWRMVSDYSDCIASELLDWQRYILDCRKYRKNAGLVRDISNAQAPHLDKCPLQSGYITWPVTLEPRPNLLSPFSPATKLDDWISPCLGVSCLGDVLSRLRDWWMYVCIFEIVAVSSHLYRLLHCPHFTIEVNLRFVVNIAWNPLQVENTAKK